MAGLGFLRGYDWIQAARAFAYGSVWGMCCNLLERYVSERLWW